MPERQTKNTGPQKVAGEHSGKLQQLLVLLGLTGFSITEPMLTIFGANPGTFYFYNIESPTLIAIYALIVALLPALALWIIIISARPSSPKLAITLFYTFIFLLGTLWAIQLLKWNFGVAGAPKLAFLSLSTGALILLAYLRWPIVNACLKLTAIAPLVIVGVFLFSSDTGSLIRKTDPTKSIARSERNLPSVVFILLDEFPTLGLFDEHHAIDPVRFPNLAEFSEQATWYRHYTVLHANTKVSVPSILTGKDPQHVPASYSNHPDSLFSLLAPTHELVAFETITGLCGLAQCTEQTPGTIPDAPAPRIIDLLTETGFLWWRRISLTDTGGAGLDNFAEEFSTRNQSNQKLTDDYKGVTGGHASAKVRPKKLERLSRFIETFVPGVPAFYYIHLQLPHVPWHFHGTGEAYRMPYERADNEFYNRDGGAWIARLKEYRFLMQAQHTDRLLGEVFSRLKKLGMWDDMLIVVTADHGRSFRLNAPGRKLFHKTIDAVAYAPLIVKRPQQVKGKIDDGNLMAYDVVPTIAEILDIELPWDTSGFPAGHPGIAERGPEKVAFYQEPKTESEQKWVFSDDEYYPSFSSRWIGSLPESGSPLALLNQDLGLDKYLNRSPKEFEVHLGGVATVQKLRLLQRPPPNQVPQGVIMGNLNFEPTGDTVLVSVNNRFVTGSPLINFRDISNTFLAMLPPGALEAENDIGIYLVEEQNLVLLSLTE